MTDLARHLAKTASIGDKVSRVYQHRATGALERFSERASEALKSAPAPLTPWQVWSEWNAYATDFAQRSVLMLDTLRQRAYELFGRPVVKAIANEPAAELVRTLHPLRVERWAFSDLNPWTAWLAPAAESVRESRKPASQDNAFRQAESGFSELVSASLDTCRVLRDAYTEAVFRQTFGSLHAFYFADREKRPSSAPAATASPGQSLIDQALETIAEGGYPEAVARVGFLLRRGGNLELVRLERNAALIKAFQDLLPALPDFEMRRVSGQQAIVCSHDRERAIETLPELVADPSDRERLLRLLDLIVNDPRVDTASVTDEQRDTYQRILGVLGADKPTPARRPRRARAS